MTRAFLFVVLFIAACDQVAQPGTSVVANVPRVEATAGADLAEPGTMHLKYQPGGTSAGFSNLHAGRLTPGYRIAYVSCTHGDFILINEDVDVVDPSIGDGENIPVVVSWRRAALTGEPVLVAVRRRNL